MRSDRLVICTKTCTKFRLVQFSVPRDPPGILSIQFYFRLHEGIKVDLPVQHDAAASLASFAAASSAASASRSAATLSSSAAAVSFSSSLASFAATRRC